MIRLRLYTTLGCHLCETLEALLARLCLVEYALERVEISEDDALVTRYGVRIPVLEAEEGETLDRGFEAPRLAAWLDARGWLDEAAWRQLQAPAPSAEPVEAKIRHGRRYLG
ncbi:glutaredoxin family protein [Bisbaumannia pacifica]|uniref:Glutaredoxin family protein n=1 Tax=Bisbaumannia pacifica TaxID=77098 RepID=A0ABD4L3V6_9GAMM|nr:glutaredoxin family protein [Halomonas pacifica]MBH8580131.1 glutaredoxin family protein [Halomonas pacifica]